MMRDYADDPAQCTQCRAIGGGPCHWHRTLADPARLARWCAREYRVESARLHHHHPNAGLLPHERKVNL